MSDRHIIGLGPTGLGEVSARQYYILFGLVQFNEVDTQRMAGDLTSYTIESEISLPGTRIALEIAAFLLIPLAVGMLIGRRYDARRDKIARTFIRISVAMIALIVIGGASAERIDPGVQTSIVMFGILGFSIALFVGGFGLLRAAGLPARDAVAAGIETSYRNISLALLVKASIWPARAGVEDRFADQVFFVVLFYGGVAIAVSLIPLWIHRRTAIR